MRLFSNLERPGPARWVLALCLWLVAFDMLTGCNVATPATPTPVTPAATAPLAAGTRAVSPTTPPQVALPPTTAAKTNQGGELRVVQSRDIQNFHPYLATDPASSSLQGYIYASGLWRRDPQTLEPVPNMAQSWAVSADGKTFTFRLRQDIQWSDGQSLTANDFQWTFDQAAKPANKYSLIENLQDIASYKARDNYTLEIALKDAMCTGLTAADVITPLPRHVWEKLDWSDGSKNPEILFPTVVSGPYRLKERVQGKSITLVRNESFFRGAPDLETYTVSIVPDPAAQLKMLLAGQVDSAPVSIDDYAAAAQNSALKLYTWPLAGEVWDYVGFNLRDSFLRDADVRHALAYAIPRPSIADQIFKGLAKPLYSAYAPTNPVYNPDVPHYDYNLDTARAILKQAGYKTDRSGNLLDAQGRAVKLKIVYNDGNTQRERTASVIQGEFAKLGINSQVDEIDSAGYVDFLKKEPFDYDLYLEGWHAPIEPYFLNQVWSEANIPSINAGAYVNKEVEGLYNRANHAPCDADSRKQSFQKIQSILANDSPYIFLAYRTGFAFLNARVVPNEPARLGIDYLPEQWYVRDP